MVRVREARPLDGYRVQLGFTDGTTGVVDLTPYLWGPVFEPLRRDPALFAEVRVDTEAGTIVWPNGADFCPDVLYSWATGTLLPGADHHAARG